MELIDLNTWLLVPKKSVSLNVADRGSQAASTVSLKHSNVFSIVILLLKSLPILIYSFIKKDSHLTCIFIASSTNAKL